MTKKSSKTQELELAELSVDDLELVAGGGAKPKVKKKPLKSPAASKGGKRGGGKPGPKSITSGVQSATDANSGESGS